MLFDRTFHPDEANQAFTVGRLLETGTYTYRPTDHHGPTLYYAAAPLQKAFGHTATGTLDGTLLRCTPLLFAILGLVLGFCALRKLTGKILPALAYVLLLGTAPIFLFFATDFIQESLLLTFVTGLFASAAGYRHALAHTSRLKPGSWALLFGIFGGLAFATKETCLISFAAVALAALPWIRRDGLSADLAQRTSHAVLAGLAFLLTAILLFSSFCTDWSGVYHAFITAPLAYLGRGTGDATASAGANWHVHPVGWYLRILFASGWKYSLLPLLLPLVAGAWPARHSRAFRFALLHAVLLLAIYSAIPYKTPWCLLTVVGGFAAAAALALAHIPSRLFGALLLVPALVVQGLACRDLNRDPDSPAIPYNYAHASPEVKELAATVANALKEPSAEPFIAVALPPSDTWPFPWYNRPFADRTGYWTTFEELTLLANVGRKPSAVIVPMTEGHLVQPLFPHLTHTKRFFMRPGVRVRVFW